MKDDLSGWMCTSAADPPTNLGLCPGSLGAARRSAASTSIALVKLVGYAGLGAGVHDSGLKHRDKGITKSGRKELRWALVEASWQAIRSNPRLRAEYDRLCQRKHPNQAIVAIARKLLVTIWYVLV